MQQTSIKANGYDYVRAHNGSVLAVDYRTGEALPAVNMLFPAGTIAYTPQQQEDYKARREAEQRKKMLRDAKNELGYFYFAEATDRRDIISSQSLARLLFLGTYLRYGSNYLYLTERAVMRKVDLQKAMKLPPKTFYRFWKDVADTYLFEDSSGQVRIADEFFRGELKSRLLLERKSKSYQQIYIDTLRQIYLKTPIPKHRYLGYVFMMLPYINFEFNILCWNPEETELEKLCPMTLDELCEVIGYAKSKRTRLLDTYRQLTFEWNGTHQHLCSFVTDDLRVGNVKIFINPHILYRGSNWHRVEILGTFFDFHDKNDNEKLAEFERKVPLK